MRTLLLPILLALQSDAAVPISRTASWAGWGAGSTLVCQRTTQSWTNPTPYQETDTWTVTANDGVTVTGAEEIAVPGQADRTCPVSLPVISTVVFQGSSKGTNPVASAPAPEQALG